MSSTVAAPSAHFTPDARAARLGRRPRSRAVAWAEIVALLLIAVTLVVATMAGASRSAGHLPSQRVHVESGQTLWSLAVAHPVAGLTTEQTADLIARTNELDDAPLAAGATISIPVAPDGNLAVACR